MAMSMDSLLKNLPLDVKTVQTRLVNDNELKQLLYEVEHIELLMSQPGVKFDGKSVGISLIYQLLLNLILNQLCEAKYLWKRLPKSLKAEHDAAALWKIGQNMFKSEYSTAFELIDVSLNSNMNEVFKPFLEKLKVEYRRRCIALVGLSYSSITIKELLGYVSNLKDANVCGKDEGVSFVKKSIISDFGLERAWILDEKSGIIEINQKRETYELDPKLMQEFTKYVCFMEAQQSV